MHEFDYHRPRSIEQARVLLSEAEDGQWLAGGMTLLPSLKLRLAQPSALIDLADIAELRGIRSDAEAVMIGAMTTHTEVATDIMVRDELPALAALAAGIGDPQVRNRGTLGGSLANADPAADYPAAVLGLGATIRTDRRHIAADEFFVDLFETALEEDELITAVHFPRARRAAGRRSAGRRSAYVKFANPASRYAVVGVFVAETDAGVRVAVTGAGPCAFRCEAMEQALAEDFRPEALAGIDIPNDDLNEDLHASADYRAHLIGVMARRAVATALTA